MQVSVFELFKPGVGPSSSHTMGPMTAAARFLIHLDCSYKRRATARVEVELYGSLALTGQGHGTDRAVMMGLLGFVPQTMDPDEGEAALAALRHSGLLTLPGTDRKIVFDEHRDILWLGARKLAPHSNALRFKAWDDTGFLLAERSYFSIGGGFVLDEEEIDEAEPVRSSTSLPYPFTSADTLLGAADDAGISIAELMLANEVVRAPREEVLDRLDAIHAAMDACIDRGLRTEGVLPGGLKVSRRAVSVHRLLVAREHSNAPDPLAAMDMVNLWALAVNEENAAGGRVVTAPTNGAAGIVPAVLRYFCHYHAATPEQIRVFLLTAAAIGALYKTNASISGAEVGCQGEVGVACSMAAAGLCAVLGGTNAQIENAAEIGMEHNLGLTCDPIGGLVQIPCIERNAMGAIKAIDAARLALLGDGNHKVSLDSVIETMKRTGADMNEIYKETSLGGLAVSKVEC